MNPQSVKVPSKQSACNFAGAGNVLGGGRAGPGWWVRAEEASNEWMLLGLGGGSLGTETMEGRVRRALQVPRSRTPVHTVPGAFCGCG